MPGCSIHIHFISPDMEEDLDGSRKQISVQQGNSNSTSWLYADTIRAVDEAGSSSAAAATNDSVLQPVIPPESTQKEFCSAAGGTSYGDTAPQMVNGMQQAASIPCGQAAMQAYMTKSTDKVPTLQLTFHKGLYHDVMAGPCCESASADLVFGANAGEHLPTLIDRGCVRLELLLALRNVVTLQKLEALTQTCMLPEAECSQVWQSRGRYMCDLLA